MKSVTQTLAKIAAIAACLSGTAALADAPDYVRVRSIVYAGTGCPAGSVAENVSPDKTALTLLFDSYVAEVGPGVPLNQKRKNCSINIDLQFPQGWSFTVATFDYRGYTSLQRNVKGLQKSIYYFQGQGQQASLETPMRGPIDRDYQIRDTLGLVAEVWSPCGASRSLNIKSEVRLDNSAAPRASGLMTVDSIDSTFTTIYGLKWKRCR